MTYKLFFNNFYKLLSFSALWDGTPNTFTDMRLHEYQKWLDLSHFSYTSFWLCILDSIGIGSSSSQSAKIISMHPKFKRTLSFQLEKLSPPQHWNASRIIETIRNHCIRNKKHINAMKILISVLNLPMSKFSCKFKLSYGQRLNNLLNLHQSLIIRLANINTKTKKFHTYEHRKF